MRESRTSGSLEGRILQKVRLLDPGTKLQTQNEQNMTKKSNAVELVSMFGKIKLCGNLHGSCSDNHTPLRGEQ